MLAVLCEFCIFSNETKKLIKCGVQEEEAVKFGQIVDALGQKVSSGKFSGKELKLINATVDKVTDLAQDNENVTILGKGGELTKPTKCSKCLFLNQKFPTDGQIINGMQQQYLNGRVSIENNELQNAELYLDEKLEGITGINSSLITTSYPLSGVIAITGSRLIISVNGAEAILGNVSISNSYVQVRYNGSAQFAGEIKLISSEMDLFATIFSAAEPLLGGFDASGSLVRAAVALSGVAPNYTIFKLTGALEASVFLLNVTLTKQNFKPEQEALSDQFTVFGNAIHQIKSVALLINVFSGVLPYKSKPSYVYIFNATDGSQGKISGVASSVRIDYCKQVLMQVNMLRVVDFLVKAEDLCFEGLQCATKITAQHYADRFTCKNISDKKLNCEPNKGLPLYDFSRESWVQGSKDNDLQEVFSFSDSSSAVSFLKPKKVVFDIKSDDENNFTLQLLNSCTAPNYFEFLTQKCTTITQTGSAAVIEKDKTPAMVALALMVTALVLLVGAVIFFIFALRKYKRTQSAPQSEERPPSKLQPVRVPSASPAEEQAEVLQVAAQPVDGSVLLKQAGPVDFAAEYERLVGK